MATKKDKQKGGVSKAQEIVILPPKKQSIMVKIKGTSPLICHKWSAKAEKMITDKQGKRARKAREVRDPQAEFEDSMYRIDRKTYGFPARAFKQALIDSCRFCEGLTMTFVKGAFYVRGDLLPIKGAKPHMRTDTVRVPPGRGGADLRYRGEFDKWEVELPIEYDANLVTPEQIVNLVNIAGWSIGVGEMRPSAPMKPGSSGMWEVAGVTGSRNGKARKR